MLRTSGSAETNAATLAAGVTGPVLALVGVMVQDTVARQSVTVLDDVSLQVWPRDILAIWGPRRSGKTTLLRVAAGVQAPECGVIALDGRDLRSRSSRERAELLRQVAYVPKEWRVACGKPVLDHVALPLLVAGTSLRNARRRAWEALERVGARSWARLEAHDLSPIQSARASLAQALVRRPRVLLVDEPGAVTSVDERDELLRLLHSLAAEASDLALVIASEDTSGLQGARRAMSLADGSLRSVEPPASVVPFRGRTTPEPAP